MIYDPPFNGVAPVQFNLPPMIDNEYMGLRMLPFTDGMKMFCPLTTLGAAMLMRHFEDVSFDKG